MLSLKFASPVRYSQLCLSFLILPIIAVLLAAPHAAAVVTMQNGTHTDALNLTPQVVDAYSYFYNLDYSSALERFQKIQQQHADDPLSTVYVLNTTVFRELYRLGLLDTTMYVHDGFLTGKHPVVEDMSVRKQVDTLAAQAIGQANQLLAANPQNVDALFARGYARSLRATYTAMVEKSYLAALSQALAARRDMEEVLVVDPKYTDAKLVVGVHEYIAGSLPLPLKMMAGLMGVGGTRAKGLDYLRDDGKNGVITSTGASTSLTLFLRREAQYKEAIATIDRLVTQYPRDFLFRLEYANLLKDDGQGYPAIAAYQEVLHHVDTPGYFPNPHWEMAWFGLGEALRGQRQYADAANAYKQAATQTTIPVILKRRTLLAAGEMEDLQHHRDQALIEYAAVLDVGGDTVETDHARRFQQSPYKGN